MCEAEPNVHEQYEEYVKRVECKESDYISAEIEAEKNVDMVRPGNFGHPWTTQNWGQPMFVWYPT